MPPRIESYPAVSVPLPECPGPWLIDMLLDAGPDVQDGAGVSPLAWRDLEAWIAATGERPKAWELRFVRALSKLYVAEQQNDDPERVMPWAEFLTAAANRQRVARNVRSMLRAR